MVQEKVGVFNLRPATEKLQPKSSMCLSMEKNGMKEEMDAEVDIEEVEAIVSEIKDAHKTITDNRPDNPEMVSYALDDMNNQIEELEAIIGQE